MAAAEGRLVVLCADDGARGVELVRRALKRLSSIAQLIAVRNGKEAVAYLQGDGKYADRSAWPLPRILVVDQWTPRLTGIEIVRWVRSDPRFSNLPVVMLTEQRKPLHGELLHTMKGAYCLKLPGAREMAAALELAICSALQMVWQSSASAQGSWYVPEPSGPMTLKNRPECSPPQS